MCEFVCVCVLPRVSQGLFFWMQMSYLQMGRKKKQEQQINEIQHEMQSCCKQTPTNTQPIRRQWTGMTADRYSFRRTMAGNQGRSLQCHLSGQLPASA